MPQLWLYGRPQFDGNLYYDELNFGVGEPVVTTPEVALGPIHNVKPYLYWSCQGTKSTMRVQ